MARNFSLTAKITEKQLEAVKALAEREGLVPAEWNRRLVERELAGRPDPWYFAAEMASLGGLMLAIAQALGVHPDKIREARKSADRVKLETARRRWLEFRPTRAMLTQDSSGDSAGEDSTVVEGIVSPQDMTEYPSGEPRAPGDPEDEG